MTGLQAGHMFLMAAGTNLQDVAGTWEKCVVQSYGAMSTPDFKS